MRQFLHDLILAAGRLSLEYRARLATVKVERKSPRDLVTEADKAVEDFLVEAIRQRYPDHSILGEETGAHTGNEYCWIIDPIDGTTSFVHQHPFYAVSIGVERQGRRRLGAVYAPVLNELFEAEAGQGATLNGQPLHVSDETDLGDSLLATGFACIRAGHEPNNLPYFNELALRIRGVRRCGSAALDCCYVAAGRLEGFWELNLKPYDVAAGLLLVEEAGGRVSDFAGRTTGFYDEVLVTNGHIHAEMVQVLCQVKQRTWGSSDA